MVDQRLRCRWYTENIIGAEVGDEAMTSELSGSEDHAQRTRQVAKPVSSGSGARLIGVQAGGRLVPAPKPAVRTQTVCGSGWRECSHSKMSSSE
jgi:hypothetical protein